MTTKETDMTAPEIKHSSGEVLLQIVYADPGSNGFYYREKKPDSVAKFYRSDALMHSPEVLALVTAAREFKPGGVPCKPLCAMFGGYGYCTCGMMARRDALSAALAAFEGVK